MDKEGSTKMDCLSDLTDMVGKYCGIDHAMMDIEAVALYAIHSAEGKSIEEKIEMLNKYLGRNWRWEKRAVLEKFFASKLWTVDVVMGRSFTSSGNTASEEKVAINEVNQDCHENALFIYLLSIIIEKQRKSAISNLPREMAESSNADTEMEKWIEYNKNRFEFLQSKYISIPVEIVELDSASNTTFRTCIKKYTSIVISKFS